MITVLSIALLVFVLASVRRIFGLAATILLWPAYLIRTTIMGIPTTALELAIYSVMIVWCWDIARRRDWSVFRLSRLALAALSIWIIGWVTASIGAHDRQASFGALKAWLVDPLLFVGLLRYFVRDRQQLLLLWRAALGSGLVVAIAGLIQLAWYPATVQDHRLSSFFHPVANYAAMYLAPLVVLGVAGLVSRFEPRRAWWFVVGVTAVALGLTLSYGGFLSAAAGVLVVVIMMLSGRRRWLTLLGLGLAGLIVVVALSGTNNFAEHFRNTDRSSSLVRGQIWRTSVLIIREHPWIGVGPNNFEAAYRAAVPRLFFPPLEWLVAKAHNLYLNLWAETGLLGLLGFLGLLAAYAAGLRPVLVRHPEHRPVAVASLAVLAAVLVHGLVDTPYFKNDLALELVFVFLLPWIGIGVAAPRTRAPGER